MQRPFVYVWQFEVKVGREAEFERHYGPDGTWAQLFRRSPDYIETLLLRDRMRTDSYLTIDRWRSEEAYRAFREQNAEDYAELDRQCASLTVKEAFLGDHEEIQFKRTG